MASIVQEKICSAAKKAGMYSILAETKDSSEQEQLSITIRYVHPDTANQHKRFLTNVNPSKHKIIIILTL